jgi:hypothetical protein
MRNLELHSFEHPEDIDEAIQAGLLDELQEAECYYCQDSVGFFSIHQYHPFCLVIDDEEREWLICVKCAEPILSGMTGDLRTPLEEDYSWALAEDIDFD